MNPPTWRGRRVLVTGHTGFKGAWLTAWLENLGADLVGMSLAAERDSVYADVEAAGGWHHESHIVDLRDADLDAIVDEVQPEVVFHLAAQALVHAGYADPIGTWSTNVMGTVRLLDALRRTDDLRVVVTATTDKVYGSARRAFTEDDPLVATDPYSGSKVAQEAVVASFSKSFFAEDTPLVAVRAGNVIGGGDAGRDRLIPDAVRSHRAGRSVELRHPDAVRPWQHVLEPLAGYIAVAEHAIRKEAVPSAINFGPDGPGATVLDVATTFMSQLGGEKLAPRIGVPDPALRETGHLSVDATLARSALSWKPRLTAAETVSWTADWYRERASGTAARELMDAQIACYEDRRR